MDQVESADEALQRILGARQKDRVSTACLNDLPHRSLSSKVYMVGRREQSSTHGYQAIAFEARQESKS